MNREKNINIIVDMICEGKVGAIFGGFAEAGSRALGHRSIIADPRMINGKDIVNKIKMREQFRPFAGSVLIEKAEEWFDLSHIGGKSNYMLYTVPVIKDKRNIIPAITHIDNSCRVQTVENNNFFYNIILEFYNRTGVPVLLNTSFNLAGEPLVHAFEDAVNTYNNSELFYLYNTDKNILEIK